MCSQRKVVSKGPAIGVEDEGATKSSQDEGAAKSSHICCMVQTVHQLDRCAKSKRVNMCDISVRSSWHMQPAIAAFDRVDVVIIVPIFTFGPG
jgi:hypothetical protein